MLGGSASKDIVLPDIPEEMVVGQEARWELVHRKDMLLEDWRKHLGHRMK